MLPTLSRAGERGRRPRGPNPGASKPLEATPSASANLDLLRSFAVLLVVAFHLAKFFDWRFGRVRVTDFGLLGVMFFFVHTTVVLMFSLERQRATSQGALFAPFMIRRVFRIYPLAILVVGFVYLFRIPSDLQFGRFHLLHQSAANLAANLLLIQNVTLQKANPGILWSLPLELQMYLVLPVLFLLAMRARPWAAVALWFGAAGLWFAVGLATGILPLREGGVHSLSEAALKYTRFGPCFLPGVIAYKFWAGKRYLSAWLWPLFLVFLCAAFVTLSGAAPIEAGWLICLALGFGAFAFREMPPNPVAWLAKRIARYSYGIYLVHYLAIWLAFAVLRRMNLGLRVFAFGASLTTLSIFLYHAIEAPMIATGIRLAERWSARAIKPPAPARRAFESVREIHAQRRAARL